MNGILCTTSLIIVFFLICVIHSKIKKYKETLDIADRLRTEIYKKNKQISDLENKIAAIETENNQILLSDKALMEEKYITRIFEILEENNYPRVTKQKLTRLWEVMSYYPPDWKLRKYVVRKRDGLKCKKCGKDLDNMYPEDCGEVHHIIPLSMNGTNEIKNLVLVCHECHKKLHNELYNFDFSKYGYDSLFGISYDKLFSAKYSNLLKEYLEMPEYAPEEPDTDIYYNISTWEDRI